MGKSKTVSSSTSSSISSNNNDNTEDNAGKVESPSAFLQFPEHDYQVLEIKRTPRTVNASVPLVVDEEELAGSQHIKDCFRLFTKDLINVKHDNLQYDGKKVAPPRTDFSDVSNVYYEGEAEEYWGLQSKKSAPLTESGSSASGDDSTATDTDISNFDKRLLRAPAANSKSSIKKKSSNRLNIFELFEVEDKDLSPSDSRMDIVNPAASTTLEVPAVRVYISVEELFSEIGLFEPFFCSIALYDNKRRLKVSETAHFDLNNEYTHSLLGKNVEGMDPYTMRKKVVFLVEEQQQNDIFVVLRVEKIMTGESEEAVSPYLRGSVGKTKGKSALQESIQIRCRRLAEHRQLFGVAVAPLTSLFPYSAMLNPIPIRFQLPLLSSRRFKIHTDDTLYEAFNDKDLKKFKGIPVELRGTIRCASAKLSQNMSAKMASATENVHGSLVLDPSFVPVLPIPTTQSQAEIISEIQEFHVSNPYSLNATPTPHNRYIHHLYVYPQDLNFNHYPSTSSARNIAVRVSLMAQDNVADYRNGLDCIYNTSGGAKFVNSALTHTTYHEQHPQYYTEVKVELPVVLLPIHHILFTFYHVLCDKKRLETAEKANTEVVLGYAVLPIYPNGNILPSQQHSLPVALPLDANQSWPPNYLPHFQLSTSEGPFKWMDARRPVFVVSTKTISTIYSQDPHIGNFFTAYNAFVSRYNIADSQICPYVPYNTISGLKNASPSEVCWFFYVLLDNLFRLLCNYTTQTESTPLLVAILNVLSFVVRKGSITNSHRDEYYNFYINFLLDTKNAEQMVKLHEEIANAWIHILIKGTQEDSDMSCRFSWFLFRVMYKSMVLQRESHKPQGYKAEKDKHNKFDASFVTVIIALLRSLIAKIKLLVGPPDGSVTQLADENELLAIWLNTNLALFLKDLLSIMDRHYVLEMIELYVTNLGETKPTQSLKWEFIRIICDYKYYIPLCKPPSQELEKQRAHTTNNSVDPHNSTNVSSSTHKGDELENAIQEKQLLNYILLRELKSMLEHTEAFPAERAKAIRITRNLLRKHDCDPRYQDVKTKQEVAGLYFALIKMIIDNQSKISRFPVGEQKDWLICFVYVLRNCNIELVLKWFKEQDVVEQVSLLELLTLLLEVFEYHPVAPLPSTKHIRKKHHLFGREIGWIVIDLLSDLIRHHSSLIWKIPQLILHCLKVLHTIVKLNESDDVISAAMGLSKHFLYSFAQQLFRKQTMMETISKFTFELLRCCNFYHQQTRARATALVYLLMKLNNNEIGDFSRMKAIAALNVSRVVGPGADRCFGPSDYHFLADALREIKKFANPPLLASLSESTSRRVNDDNNDSTTSEPKSFHGQVGNLMDRLLGVLEKSLRVERHKGDPELVADLYYEISNGYVDSPELRLAWLDKLRELHAKQENWEEASMVFIHTAGLVSDIINMVVSFEDSKGLPTGRDDFLLIAPNIKSERPLPPNLHLYDQFNDASYFTENGLVNLLKQAVVTLRGVGRWELCILVYNIIVSIHQKNRNILKLAGCYSDLSYICQRLCEDESGAVPRVGCQFYRVAFFGARLGEDFNRAEFVYKEHYSKRLADMKEYITTILKERFRDIEVVVMSNNAEVEKAAVDTEKVYFQIVSVSEHYTLKELQKGRTFMWNINKFMFEVPFTESGSTHGEIHNQYKRKTILTLERSFPYVKKRLRVVSKTELVLSPIENAIELIEGRCAALQVELNREANANTKTLQMVLQGSVLPQVNAGPVEICRVFLTEPSKFKQDYVDRLRETMAQFAVLCSKALLLNRTLINADQHRHQEEMVSGYNSLIDELKTKYGVTVPTGDEFGFNVHEEAVTPPQPQLQPLGVTSPTPPKRTSG